MLSIKRSLVFAVIYTLLMSLLPGSLLTDSVKAASALKKVEVTTPYYVLDAVQYKQKTFLLGAEKPENDGSLVVKEGNNVSEVIPSSELKNSPYIYILDDTPSKLYIRSYMDDESYIFVVNKDTNKFEKMKWEEFEQKTYAPFTKVAENAGYKDPEWYGYFFSKDDVTWVVGHINNYNGEQGAEIFINKNGKIKVIPEKLIEEGEDSWYDSSLDWSFNVDQNGNLYYMLTGESKLRVVDLQGKENVYSIPQEFTSENSSYYNLQFDNNQTIYLDREDYNSEIDEYVRYEIASFKMENNGLKLIGKKPINRYQYFPQASDGTLWYVNQDENDNTVYGYFDSSLNAHDVYATEGLYLDISVYDEKNVVFYNREVFGIHVESITIPTPEKPAQGVWKSVNGQWYYYDAQGKMKTGWVSDKNEWYYLDSKGVMKTGWVHDGTAWYYLSASGAMKTGWLQDGSKWYFLTDSGAMKTGWVEVQGKWYYLDSSGVMKNGWLKYGTTWYYLEGSGTMKTGWLKDGVKWYFFGVDGDMKTGWVNDGEARYYLESSGAMKTGWLKDGGKWYYLSGSGAMKTGWLKAGNEWYYLDKTGVMKTGWLKDGDKWYFLAGGGVMKTNWVKVGQVWYYFYSNGQMAADTTIEGFKLNADGAWVQ